MKNLALYLLTGFAMLFLPVIPIGAQEFNCRASKYADEVLICQDRELSALDTRLNRLYNRALLQADSDRDARRLRNEQRDWIKSRRACRTSESCIRRHYLRRLRELR